MSLILYQIFLSLYFAGIRCYAIFNAKAAKWVVGRKNWRAVMREKLQANEKRIWIHCSSLGEFEQGKPVMEALRKKYPNYKIVLTFFSPSGYEAYGQQQTADYVFYLPQDSRRNARDFIDMVNPTLTVFVKYEFWYHYIHTLAKQKRIFMLISATFRQDQPFFKWYGDFFRAMVRSFTWVFVQDSASVSLLHNIGLQDKVILAGDTRYDRVAAIARNFSPIEMIEKFAERHKILIAGSTWLEDEQILKQCLTALPPNWKIIIAPHDVNQARIISLGQLFGNDVAYYTELYDNGFGVDKRMLIINCIGLLAQIYAYGDIALVGGGFAKGGVHNVLEPAIFGMPIIIGPIYEKYIEAREMVAEKLITVVHNTDECTAALKCLTIDEQYRIDIKATMQTFMKQHTGSTEKIMARIVL